ncbi:MAG: DUF3489 domain-containing protein [Sphingobium sp.]
MTDTANTPIIEPAATRHVQTKTAIVRKMLERTKGATLAEIMKATCWQPHSARAFMTGLRKKGTLLVRECRPNGDSCWRIQR